MSLPLRVYYHALLANDWESVVGEQASILVDSGIDEAAESIHLSACCDSVEKLRRLKEIIRKSRKASLRVVNTSPLRYEFPALELIHEDARNLPTFIALYFHTKGVSYPDDRRKRWRDILNDGVLRRWREHYSAISTGMDVSGQNYIRAACGRPAYFSGNFWLAKSDYVATLEPPEKLPQHDRFAAESWVCSNPHAPHFRPFIEPNPKPKAS